MSPLLLQACLSLSVWFWRAAIGASAESGPDTAVPTHRGRRLRLDMTIHLGIESTRQMTVRE